QEAMLTPAMQEALVESLRGPFKRWRALWYAMLHQPGFAWLAEPLERGNRLKDRITDATDDFLRRNVDRIPEEARGVIYRFYNATRWILPAPPLRLPREIYLHRLGVARPSLQCGSRIQTHTEDLDGVMGGRSVGAVILATDNKAKQREFIAEFEYKLGKASPVIFTREQLGLSRGHPETAPTFHGNARLKAEKTVDDVNALIDRYDAWVRERRDPTELDLVPKEEKEALEGESGKAHAARLAARNGEILGNLQSLIQMTRSNSE